MAKVYEVYGLDKQASDNHLKALDKLIPKVAEQLAEGRKVNRINLRLLGFNSAYLSMMACQYFATLNRRAGWVEISGEYYLTVI